MKPFKHILFATDFSDCSEIACDYAVSMAKRDGAKLTLLHVISEPVDLRGFYVPHITFDTLEKEIEEGAKKLMEAFCRTQMGDFEVYETAIISGIPCDEILTYTTENDIDLVIMGTHGRTGIDHVLFGSTAEKVVRKSSVPVLTVRGEED